MKILVLYTYTLPKTTEELKNLRDFNAKNTGASANRQKRLNVNIKFSSGDDGLGNRFILAELGSQEDYDKLMADEEYQKYLFNWSRLVSNMKRTVFIPTHPVDFYIE
ncbi:MAG: hypothetical protein QG670_323 [Thermoproteota archaeon]|nr:hypothetical protein [Thermoproteota archaeon]